MVDGFQVRPGGVGAVDQVPVTVDDATHESIAIVADHAIGGDHLTRILDGICAQRGTPAVIRTDDGPEFTGKAMLKLAHRRGIALRLIEPSRPHQNAYVESGNRPLETNA